MIRLYIHVKLWKSKTFKVSCPPKLKKKIMLYVEEPKDVQLSYTLSFWIFYGSSINTRKSANRHKLLLLEGFKDWVLQIGCNDHGTCIVLHHTHNMAPNPQGTFPWLKLHRFWIEKPQLILTWLWHTYFSMRSLDNLLSGFNW